MDSQKWADEQDAKIQQGIRLVQQASNDALEYVQDAVENLGDQQWRKMAVETQPLEMGVGRGIAEHLVPVIYNDMPKRLRKKLKVSKTTATALREIYIGRVVKNIVTALSKENSNGKR